MKGMVTGQSGPDHGIQGFKADCTLHDELVVKRVAGVNPLIFAWVVGVALESLLTRLRVIATIGGMAVTIAEGVVYLLQKRASAARE